MTPFREAIERLRQDPASQERLAGALMLEAVELLEGDELDVIGFVLERVRLGHARYGQLDIAGDSRDWRREAIEEAADTPIYLAIETLKAAMPR